MSSHVAAFVESLAVAFEAAYWAGRRSPRTKRPPELEAAFRTGRAAQPQGNVLEGGFDLGLDEVPPTGTAHWHIRAEELGRRLARRMPRGWRRSKLLSRVEGNRLFLWVEAHRRANANVPQ